MSALTATLLGYQNVKNENGGVQTSKPVLWN